MSAEVENQLIERLAELASEHVGFNLSSISRDALRRFVSAERVRGVSVTELRKAAIAGDRHFIQAVCDAVVVGETFFFRHPEHFDMLVSQALPERLDGVSKSLRLWSAGCSSGEEAYSLAACMHNTVPKSLGIKVQVVGTDICERLLTRAASGVYSRWSRRESGTILFPIVRNLSTEKVEVLEEIRAITTFSRHNLLEPADHLGLFDVIFCRNVLVYFRPEAAKVVRANLARVLAPGGYLFFGTMDADGTVPGLQKIGPFGMQVYVAPTRPPLLAPPRAVPPPPAVPPLVAVAPTLPKAVPTGPPLCVSQHLQALSLIEQGQLREAEQALARVRQAWPEYLPGALELALLRVQLGNRSGARELMQEVLRRAASLPPEELVEGPEPLPARFYWASASAFFDQGRAAR